MSVLKPEYGWWSDDDFLSTIKRKTKRREATLVRKEIQEALQEMENEMSTVYLILNETTFVHSENVAVEPVKLFASLQGALDFIHELAEEHDVYVEDDADSVYLPPEHAGIDTDEYYIIEMEVND